MAEVFASPSMLGKRSHLATCEVAETSPFQSSGCKRRRPFESMPSPGGESMRVAPGFDGLGQSFEGFGGQGWAMRGNTQGGFMFGQAPSNQPPQQQQEESGHGGSMLGKRHFMSGEAMARGAGQEDRHSGVHGAVQDEALVHEVVNKLKAEFAAYVSKREGEVKAMVEQHEELNRAYSQSQVQTEQLRAENRILKKGIAVQASKVEKYEEEIRQLHTAGREAIQYIERLQNANHALTLQLMQGKGSCHDFINHQGPPDVF